MFDSCSTAEDRPSPAETRAERRARRLERMGEIGLDIAEKLQRQAELAAAYAETDAVPDNLPHARRLDEIGRTFAQVFRAVTLAAALEDRMDRGLPAIPDDDRPFREREAREKRAEIARSVTHAIEADPTISSRRRIVDLRLNLDRLLDREMAELDRFLRRPFQEIEARLRRDLGLEPNEAAEGEAHWERGHPARVAAGTPALREVAHLSAPLASRDAEAEGHAHTERGRPARVAGKMPALREAAAGREADVPSPPCRERKIACVGSSTVRGRGPP